MTIALKPEQKICQRCGGLREGIRYCKPCALAVRRERAVASAPRKPCPECGRPKEPGKRRFCIACRERRQPLIKLAERDRSRYRNKQQRLARGAPPRAPKVDETGRVRCATCLEYLPADQFRRRSGGSTQYTSQCRSCYSTYLHEQRLEAVFGMTLEQYEQLFEQQGGRCAICMRAPRTRRLAVDHAHDTGEIRGLLCTRCNHKVLGAANESPSLLRRAARYLEMPPAKTGAPLESLGDAEDQKWQAFEEAADKLAPGEVEVCDGLVAMSMKTARALWQAAGLTMVIEGKHLRPKPQLAIDDMQLLDRVWKSIEPLLRDAGYGEARQS